MRTTLQHAARAVWGRHSFAISIGQEVQSLLRVRHGNLIPTPRGKGRSMPLEAGFMPAIDSSMATHCVAHNRPATRSFGAQDGKHSAIERQDALKTGVNTFV